MLSEKDFLNLTVSEYCLKRGGACNGCPHQRLESQRCLVKYAPGIAERLRIIRRVVNCEVCRVVMPGAFKHKKRCDPCRLKVRAEEVRRKRARAV